MNLRILAIAALAVVFVNACSRENPFHVPEDFRQACKDAQVRFYKPPSSPVQSVLWKQEPEQARAVTFHGYVIDSNQSDIRVGPLLSRHTPLEDLAWRPRHDCIMLY